MKKTADYYLSKGLDAQMAEYFANGRKKIVKVKPNDDYTLTISFDNGEKRLYNVTPLLEEGTVFQFLKHIDNFRRVYVDEEHCVSWDVDPNKDSKVKWDNKISLCSDTCYVDSKPI